MIGDSLNNIMLVHYTMHQNLDRDYLCFTANTAGSTVMLQANGNISTGNFKISTDKSTWNDYTAGTVITLTNADDKVYFWNTNNTLSQNSWSTYYKFVMTGSVAASGNVDSMINFSKLTNYCYYSMFSGCTSLTTAPELPSTTLAYSCYQYMFYGCTGLTTAPTTLPATTLANWCYYNMFSGCTNLTTAPTLPATTLANGCYRGMFFDCTSLTSLTVDFTDWNTSINATNDWVAECSNISEFVFTCPSALDTTTTGDSYVLSNWTINKVS